MISVGMKSGEVSDYELVAETLKNKEAYGKIIERYEGPLFRYIRRLTNVSPEDAEDLLQEVFIKAYQNLRDVDKRQKFSSWMYRITRNHVISHFRKHQARPEGHRLELDDHAFESLVGECYADSPFDKEQLREQMDKILKKMDQKYREVLVLKYFQEKSYDEISYILNKPSGSVATLLRRAKKQFQLVAEKMGVTFDEI